MENIKACETKSRANICDTAKENRIMLADLRHMLTELSYTLENCPEAPCNEKLSEEPKCLLDEVLLHKGILEEMQCIVKRMYVSLQG